jgi:hypothetical protein
VPSAAPSVAEPSAAPNASSQAGPDEIVPVYPVDAGPPDPRTVRFCMAVELLPEQRKAQCCATPASPAAGTFAGQCERTLTAALASHAVSVTDDDVDKCVAAMTQATDGCDWVTWFSAPVPPACDGIIHGALPAKAACRSSLECAPGLHCQGLSTIDVGVCGPPSPAGSVCRAANDMLATFTRQDAIDRPHPECAGYCRARTCTDAVAAGAACKGDVECGSAGHCRAGKCASGPPPAVGQPCDASCATGAKCVKGTCAAPKAEASTCTDDSECRGKCVHGDAGGDGTCTKTCPVMPKLGRGSK